MSFNFKRAMLKASKDLKVFLDNYIENMDYELMSEISEKNINEISKDEFLKLGIEPSTYHQITYISDEDIKMGFSSDLNDELKLNKNAIFYEFKKLPIFGSDFILEFYNNICILTKGDQLVKMQINTGKQLISEIYEHLSLKTYKEDLNQVIAEYQQEIIEEEL